MTEVCERLGVRMTAKPYDRLRYWLRLACWFICGVCLLRRGVSDLDWFLAAVGSSSLLHALTLALEPPWSEKSAKTKKEGRNG